MKEREDWEQMQRKVATQNQLQSSLHNAEVQQKTMMHDMYMKQIGDKYSREMLEKGSELVNDQNALRKSMDLFNGQ